MPLLSVHWCSFRRPRKDDRLSQPPGVNSVANRARTQAPGIPSHHPNRKANARLFLTVSSHSSLHGLRQLFITISSHPPSILMLSSIPNNPIPKHSVFSSCCDPPLLHLFFWFIPFSVSCRPSSFLFCCVLLSLCAASSPPCILLFLP